MARTERLRKLRRTDYDVAWIAPVADIEVLPSRLLLDEEHDTPEYDANYDDNIYTCGSMSGHNVVIATCPPGLTGNVNAAHVTGFMFNTFPRIRMTILVGIGGGVPRSPLPKNPLHDIRLGDVVVSWPGDAVPACIYYDSGRSHPDGRFETVGLMDRPSRILLNAVAKISADEDLDQNNFEIHRNRLLGSQHRRKFRRPASADDKLFKASYRHHGEPKNSCVTCDPTNIVPRRLRTREDRSRLIFHRGRIATGNAVIKDASRRDQIRDQCGGALCIEMEAAGVDAGKPCLVIRGVSDYSDSHKSDMWQTYAAGNAAIFARELLGKIPPTFAEENMKAKFVVPFGRNDNFIGRESILSQVVDRISPRARSDNCQRTALEGLGGVGKTQVAIEAAYRIREDHPNCSVFWVPVLSQATFENAYRDIGRAIGIDCIDNDGADVKALVCGALSDQNVSPWLLIIDNADDADLFLGDANLVSYLPFNFNGSILLTTRNHQVAVEFEHPRGIINLRNLDASESLQLLCEGLESHQTSNTESTHDLLEYLAHLPLAIKQASAYMQSNPRVTTSRYLEYCRSSDDEMIDLLSREFNDQGRYNTAQNPVATTWLISFQQIQKQSSLAAEFLSCVCYLSEKDIPVELLPPTESDRAADEAMGILSAYGFIIYRHQRDKFDIHRLVRLAMRNWLRQTGQEAEKVTKMMVHVDKTCPWPEHENRGIWTVYMPHFQSILNLEQYCLDPAATVGLLRIYGQCSNMLGNYPAFESISRRALSLSERKLGRKDKITAACLTSLSASLISQGDYKAAELVNKKALKLSTELFGPDDDRVMENKFNHALLFRRQGKYQESERLLQEVSTKRESILGLKHPNTLSAMGLLSGMIELQGRFEEALKLARKVLDISSEVLGWEHCKTRESMADVASCLGRQGRYAEAELLCSQALEIHERVLGSDHPNTLRALSYLGSFKISSGKFQEAEKLLRHALELQDRKVGHHHPNTILTINHLGLSLAKQGLYLEAIALLKEAFVLSRETVGSDHPATQYYRNDYERTKATMTHAGAEQTGQVETYGDGEASTDEGQARANLSPRQPKKRRKKKTSSRSEQGHRDKSFTKRESRPSPSRLSKAFESLLLDRRGK